MTKMISTNTWQHWKDTVFAKEQREHLFGLWSALALKDEIKIKEFQMFVNQDEEALNQTLYISARQSNPTGTFTGAGY